MPTADIRPTVDYLVRASRSRRSAMRAARATREFNAAEIGALAHLYRGEIYRSTAWRTRLDNTTNWAVAGLGLAMSISFSRPDASALPILMMGVLIVVFLFLKRADTAISMFFAPEEYREKWGLRTIIPW